MLVIDRGGKGFIRTMLVGGCVIILLIAIFFFVAGTNLSGVLGIYFGTNPTIASALLGLGAALGVVAILGICTACIDGRWLSLFFTFSISCILLASCILGFKLMARFTFVKTEIAVLFVIIPLLCFGPCACCGASMSRSRFIAFGSALENRQPMLDVARPPMHDVQRSAPPVAFSPLATPAASRVAFCGECGAPSTTAFCQSCGNRSAV